MTSDIQLQDLVDAINVSIQDASSRSAQNPFLFPSMNLERGSRLVRSISYLHSYQTLRIPML